MFFFSFQFRTITMSLVSFIWVIYIAHKRRRFQERQSDSKKSS